MISGINFATAVGADVCACCAVVIRVGGACYINYPDMHN